MKYENPYKEAMRYIDNANATLKLAGIDDKFYADAKYVKTACGTAYSGVLFALDQLFDIKDMPKRRGRKAIDYYQSNLSKMDKRLLRNLNNVYHILHLEGYYEGETYIKTIESGFENAISIISALKPYSKNGENEN
jgi:hypothetical protein